MSKHTPGPWDARPQYRGGTYGRRAIPEEVIGYVVSQADGDGRRGGRIAWPSLAWADTNEGAEPEHPENVANARLIAAAPDLLEALKMAHERLLQVDNGSPRASSNGSQTEVFDAIDDAIAKAEGGAS